MEKAKNYRVLGIGYDENKKGNGAMWDFGSYNKYEEAYESFVRLQCEPAVSFFRGKEHNESDFMLLEVVEGNGECERYINKWLIFNPRFSLENKVTEEIKCFRRCQKRKGIEKAYANWYEISIMEEVYSMIMNADLNETVKEWLAGKDKPLKSVCDKVLSSEYGFAHNWEEILDWLEEVISDLSRN